jgi:hypothetical protein
MLMNIMALINVFKIRNLAIAECCILAYFYGIATSESIQFTYPIYQIAKMLTSLILFAFELAWLSSRKEETRPPLLRYVIGRNTYPWNTCHAGIAVDDVYYHYSFGTINANTSERVYKLQASKGKSSYISNSMLCPCVGIALISNETEIVKKLETSGKCHDWAAVSLYLISYHKFLTYSLVTPLRWTTWLTVAMWLMFKLVGITNEQLLLIDDFYIFFTIIDCLNFPAERLVKNSNQSKSVIPYRGLSWELLKFVVTWAFMYIYSTSKISNFFAPYGYVCYVLISAILCICVHFILNCSLAKKDKA